MTKIARLASLFILLFAGILSSSAQQRCNLGGGDTVEIFSTILDSSTNTVQISVGNDSKDIAANVTVEVEVTYKNGNTTKTTSYTARGQVGPQKTESFTISIAPNWNNNNQYLPTSAKATSITGAKCQ